MIRETVMAQLSQKFPSQVQVVSALCVTRDKDARQEILRRCAGGGGTFKTKKGDDIKLLGANLNDIANQADDIISNRICMNPNYMEFKFPQIKAHPWHKVFHKRMPPEAVDLVSRLLQYSPNLRCTTLEACVHPFFEELRDPKCRLPNGRPLPSLFNFKPQELKGATPDILQRLIPEHARKQNPMLAL